MHAHTHTESTKLHKELLLEKGTQLGCLTELLPVFTQVCLNSDLQSGETLLKILKHSVETS